MLQTISISIRGKVQGVFYRQSTREKARQLGLTGFVQNLPDKTVFIMATGLPEQLDELVSWCRVGPPAAKVDEVVTAKLPTEIFTDFSIRRF